MLTWLVNGRASFEPRQSGSLLVLGSFITMSSGNDHWAEVGKSLDLDASCHMLPSCVDDRKQECECHHLELQEFSCFYHLTTGYRQQKEGAGIETGHIFSGLNEQEQ